MEVRLSEKAINEGILRIWLRRIPIDGGILFAFATKNSDDDEPIGMATLYGRGHGSSARERTMLIFRLSPDKQSGNLAVGDLVEIKIEGLKEGEFRKIDLDIVAVE